MKLKQVMAAAALLCAGAAQAGNPVSPGGDLGNLNLFPALYGGSSVQPDFAPVVAGYTFSLSVASDVFGSIGALNDFLGLPLSPVSFLAVAVDGVPLTFQPSQANSTDLVFSASNLAIGPHTLAVLGFAAPGQTAFLGSIYAQQTVSQVPEPGSLALLLAGAGIVGVTGLRRRAA